MADSRVANYLQQPFLAFSGFDIKHWWMLGDRLALEIREVRGAWPEWSDETTRRAAIAVKTAFETNPSTQPIRCIELLEDLMTKTADKDVREELGSTLLWLRSEGWKNAKR